MVLIQAPLPWASFTCSELNVKVTAGGAGTVASVHQAIEGGNLDEITDAFQINEGVAERGNAQTRRLTSSLRPFIGRNRLKKKA